MIAEKMDRKAIANTFLLVLGYGMCFYLFQVFLYKTGIISALPSDTTLRRWDAGIYERASQIGFYYHSEMDNNSSIFVLFPWVWHLLHTGLVGISVVNYIFFAIGFTIITTIYPVTLKDKLLWLTTPSLYFMWVPYTEALYCLLITLSFYGIAKKNKWIVWSSLFIVSLCRPTALFLTPALLVMELLAYERKEWLKALGRYIVHYAAPTLCGTAAFVLVQYHYTGTWFPYYMLQAKYLGHKWALPVLPFSNFYGGQKIIWLSALAMVVCLIALSVLLFNLFKWLTNKRHYADKLYTLMLSYLPLVLFTMVFCNPTWGSNTTNLLGLHRYALCTPFIFILLYHFTTGKIRYRWIHFVAIFCLCNAVWCTMGAYVHIQKMLFYSFNTLIVLGYMAYNNNKNNKTEWAVYALIAVNVFLQINLYQLFLQGAFTD